MSTSSPQASPAKISALQVLEKAWKESEADYFLRSCAWPKKSSPNFYSLKMSQLSQQGEGSESLKKLPRWGMTVDGALYPLRPWELYKDEKDGFCWPNGMKHWIATPRPSQDYKPILAPTPSCVSKNHGLTLPMSIGLLNPELIGKRLSAEFLEVLMGYPIGWTECKL